MINSPDRNVSGISNNRNIATAELSKLFSENYVFVQYHFVQFLMEHLSDVIEPLERDFECMLVLAALGQRRLEAEIKQTSCELAAICMSVSRLSDVCSLSRQTVRRKLALLESRGWVRHDEKLGWYVAGRNGESGVRTAFSDIEVRAFNRLATLYLRLTKLLNGSDDFNAP